MMAVNLNMVIRGGVLHHGVESVEETGIENDDTSYLTGNRSNTTGDNTE